MTRVQRFTAPLSSTLLVGVLLTSAGCASSTSDASEQPATPEKTEANNGIRLVSAQEGSEIQSSPPSDLVILDVRTPEEFDDGHLDGAIMIDFYEDDFADRLGELDPDVPYLLYCRSGNRSGQTAVMMADLGFVDVADVDGGIVAWTAADLPVVTQ